MADDTEQSVYGTTGSSTVRMPLLASRNVLSDLFDFALTSVYQSYRVWDPSYSDSRDPDLWEKIRRDAVIAAACEQRLHSVAARWWRIVPGGEDPVSEAAAEIVDEMVKGIERFGQTRYELASAVVTARAFAYIKGERRVRAIAGRLADWWVPTQVEDIDRRRFHHAPVRIQNDDGTTSLKTRLMIWDVANGRWKPVENLWPLIRHIYNDEEARLGYGRGLLEAIYFYSFIKGQVLREGLQGLERWAQGAVVAKIDGLRNASTGKTNTAVQNAWLEALKAWRSQHALTHDARDEVALVNGPGEGHQMVHEWLRYLDDSITRIILGSVLPSGGGGQQGSFARAEVEADSTESLIQYDRLMLDETLTRDLIGCLWYYNRRQFQAQGLGSAKRPQFSSVQERKADPREAAEVIATLHAAGIPLREDEVYQRTGFTAPGPTDKVIPGAQQGLLAGADPLARFLPKERPNAGIGPVKPSASFAADEPLSDCVERKIKILHEEHPDWEQDRIVAAAYSMCREGRA